MNVQEQAGSEQTVPEDAERKATVTGLVAGAPYTVVMATVSGSEEVAPYKIQTTIERATYIRL